MNRLDCHELLVAVSNGAVDPAHPSLTNLFDDLIPGNLREHRNGIGKNRFWPGISDQRGLVKFAMNRDHEHGFSAADPIAALQSTFIDPLTIHVGSIGAFKVKDDAERRMNLDQEMRSRKILVLCRKSKVCMQSATDQKSISLSKFESLSSVGAFNN